MDDPRRLNLPKLKKRRGDTALKIVVDLAAWSDKYPRGRIYPMSGKENMDAQLVAIEDRAKALVTNTKTE